MNYYNEERKEQDRVEGVGMNKTMMVVAVAAATLGAVWIREWMSEMSQGKYIRSDKACKEK